jgi:hypothetical protein
MDEPRTNKRKGPFRKAPDVPPKKGGMKRSHAIALGATGVILAGAWLGSGNQRVVAPAAETASDALIFTSLEECLAARRPLMPFTRGPDGALKEVTELSEPQKECQRDFAAATTSHATTAPKFGTQSECESQYGAAQCRSTTFNGASVFVPAMVGFMVANYLSGNRNAQPLMPARPNAAVPCPPGVTPQQQPGCLVQRTATTSSSSGSSSGWRSWSTSSGHHVSRDTSSSPTIAAKVPSGAAAPPAARTALGAAPFRTVAPRSTSTSSSVSRSSTSRGGFGSTSRSIFSSSG